MSSNEIPPENNKPQEEPLLPVSFPPKSDSNLIETFSLGCCKLNLDIFLIIIMINNFLVNACFSNIMPFFPQEAHSKGVPEYIVGIIFAALPFGGIISSFFLAKYISKIGRKRALLFGVFANIVTAAVLGCLDFVENEMVFIVIAIISRIFQGVARSAYSTATFSSISVIYPSSMQKKIGYTESVSGLGMMLGPLLGSGLYSLGGYPTPFFCFAGIFLLMFPVTIINLNKLKILDVQESKKQRILKLSSFVFERRVSSVFLALIMGNINLTWLGPTFADHLISYGMEAGYVGLIYPVGTIAYILSIRTANTLFKNVEKKLLISLGLFINIIAQALVGPQPYVFPHHISMVIVSQFFLGSSLAFIFIPFIPEVSLLGAKIYPNDKASVTDMASGLFSAGITIGGVLGPVLGGVFGSMLGFVYESSVFGLAVSVVFIVYLTVGDGGAGIYWYFKNRKLEKNKNDEKEEKCEIRVEETESLANDEGIKRNEFNSTLISNTRNNSTAVVGNYAERKE